MTRTEKSNFLKANIGKSVFVTFYGQRSLSIVPVKVGRTNVVFKYDRKKKQDASNYLINLYDVNALTLNEGL